MEEYPLPKFHFQVEWGGARLGFIEVSGLDAESEVIEYRTGDSPQYTKLKMPGLQKHSNVTLKRGTYKGDNEFFIWWNTVALNTVQRRDVTISLLDETHAPVMVWKLKNAWASKVVSTDLKADGNETAVESIEVVYDSLSIQNE